MLNIKSKLMLFFPSRENLIKKNVEKAVLRMQSVIELGRVVRDRKTLPLKVKKTLPGSTIFS